MIGFAPTPLASIQLLLSALQPDQTPDHWESDRARLGVDWDGLAVRAIVLGLAPQLYRRISNWGLRPPARAAAKLAATYHASENRNTAIFHQLGETLTALAKRGLHPVALKGVHLAAAVYPEPALRPMNDIDLLFAPEELLLAESILESLGYGGKHKSSALGAGVTKHTSTFRREAATGSTPNPYLSPDADRMIEPHTSLEESWFGLKVDITPGVRERAVEADLLTHPCRVLSSEDLLLHLCVHFCFHLIMGAPSMVQLADLLAVMHRQIDMPAATAEPYGRSTPAGAGVARLHSTALNWTLFVTRALSSRAAPYTLAALTLAHKLLGVSVPTETLDALAQATPDRLRQRIASLGLVDILRRTQQKPLTRVSQRIARGFADRAEAARWAIDWPGRWEVWRTAFDIFATDTGQILLGKIPTSQTPHPK